MPLTAKQELEIHNLAVEKILEDCQKSAEYLESVVKGFVHTMTLEQRLYEISSDPQNQKEDLGFDPTTGETYDEENDNGG